MASDTTLSGEGIATIYQKRWNVEPYHKPLKQNASLEKSPTQTVTTQANHFFASLCGYIKFELLKSSTRLNHFALKSKLYLSAIQSAYAALRQLNPAPLVAYDILHGYRESIIIFLMAIHSFGDSATTDLYHGRNTSRARRFPQSIVNIALRKTDVLNAAHKLDDLRSPPGNRLEALKGDLAGFHSIRVNDQWRITFRWNDGVHDVSLVDYH